MPGRGKTLRSGQIILHFNGNRNKVKLFMRKYNSQLMPLLLVLFVMTNSYCSNGNDSSIPSDSTTTTAPADTDTSQPSTIPTSSRLTELETQLEEVKKLITANEKKCYSVIGDATRATYAATNADLSPEDREVAEERAQAASAEIKKCEEEQRTEKSQLEEKQAVIEAEINTLKGQ